MRKLFYFLVAILAFSACSEKPGYQINGTVADASLNGNYVYLYEYGTDGALKDSALVENGTFQFKGTQYSPAVSVIRFSEDVKKPANSMLGMNASYVATFLLENGKLNVILDEFTVVTGTPENDALASFQGELRKLYTELNETSQKIRSEEGDAREAAEKKYNDLTNERNAIVESYIKMNNNSLIAGKTLHDFRHYLSEDVRRNLVRSSGDIFKRAPGMSATIEHLATLEKVAIGKKFSDLTMKDPDGKDISLSEYAGKGKYVMIDFWAAWCPPCRADMPHLVEVYKQYKNKGFEIVGVSFDRSEDDWKKGIKDMNMTWPQMSDIKYWQSEGAAVYGVNSIPHTVLLDKEGTIIAKNLRGDALDAKLKELLN